MSGSRSSRAILLVIVSLAAVCVSSSVWEPALAAAEPPKMAADSRLEFRIVANELDDQKAFQAARKYFADAAGDRRRKAELDEQSRRGAPPPPPQAADGKPF